MSGTDFAVLLELLAAEVSKLTADEVAGVLSGQMEMRVNVVSTEDEALPRRRTVGKGDSSKSGKKERVGPRSPVEIQGTVAALKAATTRGEGESLLEMLKNKRELEHVARAFDVPVVRSDSRAFLMEKVVEAAIGYRLRAHAIRVPKSGRSVLGKSNEEDVTSPPKPEPVAGNLVKKSK